MLARALVAALGLILPAVAAHAEPRLAISAAVAKRVPISVQRARLEVRSTSREGVALTFGTSTIVVPGGVQVLDLRKLGLPAGVPLQITASPL